METSFNDLDCQALLESYHKGERLRKISQIARFISTLPSDKVLKEFCKTEDLQFFWWQLRCFYRSISECLVILFLQDNIEDCKLDSKEVFEEATEQKWINRRDLMLYELESERLLKEWNLIEAGFPYLIAEMANFQVHEDVTFFCNLLKSQAVQPIKQRASSYYEVLLPDRARVFEQTYEAAQGSIEEKNKVLSNPLVHRDELKEKIINFLWQKSLSDQLIKKKLEDLQTIHNDLALTASESCSARKSSGKRIKSEVWKNGERYLLTRKGLEKASYLEELKSHMSESSLQEIKSLLQQLIQAI